MVPRKSPPRKDVVFRRLEASVSHDEWRAALEATADDRFHSLMLEYFDPANKKSLPQCAREVGLTYPQVLKAITQYRLDQGLLRMSAHVPQVLEDVAVDAKSQLVPCPSCKGAGKLTQQRQVVLEGVLVMDESGKRPLMTTVEEKCWTCEGVGKLRKVGDADARKLMFDTLKLTGQKGPLVAQQFNLGAGASPEDAVEAAQQVLDAPSVKVPE